MRIASVLLLGLAVAVPTLPAQADAEKDCLLKGTVRKSESGSDARIAIHSVSRYDSESKCQIRRNKKLEFRLPADTRLEQAPDGSSVKYRYRINEDGRSEAELISVGT